MTGVPKRGRFILFEGCDGVGKTTQMTMLFNLLCTERSMISYITFPFRQCLETGQMIDDHLRGKVRQDTTTITEVFSKNRWIQKDEILARLNEGHDLLVDRYVYSGRAYALAQGLDEDWVFSLDEGLPKPDLVIYLTRDKPHFDAENKEIYDKVEFQNQVKNIFEDKMYDKTFWVTVDTTGKTSFETHCEIIKVVKNVKIDEKNKEVGVIYSFSSLATSTGSVGSPSLADSARSSSLTGSVDSSSLVGSSTSSEGQMSSGSSGLGGRESREGGA